MRFKIFYFSPSLPPSFPCPWSPFDPAPSVKKVTLLPLNCFWDWLSVCVYVSLPLGSLFCIGLHTCPSTNTTVLNSMPIEYISKLDGPFFPLQCFFLRIILTILIPLLLHIHFRIILSMYIKSYWNFGRNYVKSICQIGEDCFSIHNKCLFLYLEFHKCC